ncbi:hypothetical protein GCM10009069_22840 [Algimonas arctica]|uniref:HMA domain-containing protein n=1 Tax=Algimonas arctica TaxID=1479486 RepID=A0A8J3CR34_9PROT|nr:cation transporter [Algimonas arctica]GHA99487.1 hypothetical protein GCM10009069_22840 [Algimonas arctica]
MNKFVLILAGVATLATGAFAICCPSFSSAYAQTEAATTEITASFTIGNMTCATCPISVKKAMKRVDGVKAVDIDFGSKIATVVYDPQKTSATQIAAASTGVGYPASEVKN